MAELARIQRVVVLQGVDLFEACNAEQILRISGIANPREFAAGASIYERKQPADALYCLVEGGVEINDGAGNSRLVGPSMPFGVEDILSGRLRTEDAEAVEPSLALAIDAEDFFDLLANNIDIVRALFRKILRERPASGVRDGVEAVS